MRPGRVRVEFVEEQARGGEVRRESQRALAIIARAARIAPRAGQGGQVIPRFGPPGVHARGRAEIGFGASGPSRHAQGDSARHKRGRAARQCQRAIQIRNCVVEAALGHAHARAAVQDVREAHEQRHAEASPLEILASKFLFYPALGIGLAVLLSGIYNPAVLRQPFYWLAVGFSTAGFLGVGMTVASLARTQREASMGALCYLLAVTLILFICQQTRVPLLPYLALEFHGPRILQAALGQSVTREHWGHLGGAAALAIGWLGLATYLFRRRGWQ